MKTIAYIELTPIWINVKCDGFPVGQLGQKKHKGNILPGWTYAPDNWRQPIKNFGTLEEAKTYVEAFYQASEERAN